MQDFAFSGQAESDSWTPFRTPQVADRHTSRTVASKGSIRSHPLGYVIVPAPLNGNLPSMLDQDRKRHGKGVSSLGFLLLILLLAGSGFADSQVTMHFLGHGGSGKNPVYPWYLQVDSVPTTLIWPILTFSSV